MTADRGPAPLTPEEAVEKALLHTFQLSNRDYRKMQRAMSEVAFVRALEQDGYTVARSDERERSEELAGLAMTGASLSHLNRSGIIAHHGDGNLWQCHADRCVSDRRLAWGDAAAAKEAEHGFDPAAKANCTDWRCQPPVEEDDDDK
jgi:hypothetical protein